MFKTKFCSFIQFCQLLLIALEFYARGILHKIDRAVQLI